MLKNGVEVIIMEGRADFREKIRGSLLYISENFNMHPGRNVQVTRSQVKRVKAVLRVLMPSEAFKKFQSLQKGLRFWEKKL